MDMDRLPITKQGSIELKQELDRLIKVERSNISTAIAEARAMGDLKENAEYHAAREKQSFIEGRINELESILSNAEVIDISQMVFPDKKAVFGATVTFKYSSDDSIVTYKIVGDCEADIDKKKIAVTSPIARALIGKRPSEKSKFGDKEIEIIKVEYIA